jgi:hypothetical protein
MFLRLTGGSPMDARDYLIELNKHLSHLYAFARQMNELDFAMSLAGEFRGAQDPGWATTITAREVYREITERFEKQAKSKADVRIVLFLYCQLAEAGGVYEAIKNVLGVISLKAYLLWPFKDLVRVRPQTRRVVGPNANATFRDLAANAKTVGLSRLSELLEVAFRDDLRNGIAHADYVIWEDGVRLANRNGGMAAKLAFDELNDALMRGVGFFQVLTENNQAVIHSFDPPRTIIGRFSANFPMPWTVYFDPTTGVFGIKGSSPGVVTTPEFLRQEKINGLLGGRVLACYTVGQTPFTEEIERHILAAGFEPNNISMTSDHLSLLVGQINRDGLWDARLPKASPSEVLLASPWGFRWILTSADFDSILGPPAVEFAVD